MGWLLLFAALLAYALPWLIGSGGSLSPGAYDLAEWVSLHPAARYGQPPLLPSFLLRFSLACLALIFAVAPLHIPRRVRGLGILLFTIALLPPFEFFTIYRDDPNYQQQFSLALVTLIGGGIGLSRFTDRWRLPLTALLTGMAVLTSIAGFSQSYILFQELNIRFHLGAGVVIFVLANVGVCIGIVGILLQRINHKKG
ncbi:MAG: hypothetical protein H6672_09985 [Anaerolineaceae bacterium]|nr:hypothetical protein [Anaerolineaceae bacterium]